MLCATNNKSHSSLVIYGDYYDLRDVHRMVHDLCEYGGLSPALMDFLLEFAYDLRKAYEGKREKEEFGSDWLDKVNYRGVTIYWPYYVVYLRLLRQCASHLSTKRWQQGVLYQLEGLVEQTLSDARGDIPGRVTHWIDHSLGFDADYLPEWIRTCCRYYVEGTGGERRVRRLLTVLARLSPISPEYREFYASMVRIAKKKWCSIFSLQDNTPWPDEADDDKVRIPDPPFGLN